MRCSILPLSLMVVLLGISRGKALELPALFSDHMVLQQNKQVSIWGTAEPGEKISISAEWGKSAQTQTDSQGRWQLKLPTPKAGGPFRITITSEKEKKILQDVLIGEVWLCSGQSNMEMPLMGWPPNDLIDHSAESIQNAQLPMIRLFTVSHAMSAAPQSDCSGTWLRCTPETAKNFSATAFFYGRTLYENLNLPIGLIHSSWGGTLSQAWTSAEFLRTLPEFESVIEKIRHSAGQMEKYQQWLESHPKITLSDRPAEERWTGLDFEDKKCSTLAFADENWHTMNLPMLWEQSEMGEFDGVVWFRKIIDLPAAWAGQELVLELGPIDDMDRTYVNGTLVGQHEQDGLWQSLRRYPIPGSLIQAGKNVVAVRVLDLRGGGGIFGKTEQLKIYPNAAPDQSLSLAGSWKYLPVAELRNGTFYRFSTTTNDFFSHPTVPIQISANTPTFLYNGMIAPLIPFTIKGAIWYQGESNSGNPQQYRTLFPLLIQNWRHDWGLGDFPFYFVQIAPWEYGIGTRSQELREAQRLSMAVPHTGMAVTLDIGNPKNIHPANKLDVGKRLAAWALAKEYGKKVIYSGPLYQRIKVEKNRIRIDFKYCGSGLMAAPSDLRGFEIAGVDRQFHPAEAVIRGNQVVVQSNNVKEPVAVRYAWSNTPTATLFNKEGLPASSFRSDDWPE